MIDNDHIFYFKEVKMRFKQGHNAILQIDGEDGFNSTVDVDSLVPSTKYPKYLQFKD